MNALLALLFAVHQVAAVYHDVALRVVNTYYDVAFQLPAVYHDMAVRIVQTYHDV